MVRFGFSWIVLVSVLKGMKVGFDYVRFVEKEVEKFSVKFVYINLMEKLCLFIMSGDIEGSVF